MTDFVQALSSLINQPNFIQGGALIIALVEMVFFIYIMRELRLTEKSCHERMESINRDSQQQIMQATKMCADAISKDADAKVKLAESIALHTKSVERIERFMEARI